MHVHFLKKQSELFNLQIDPHNAIKKWDKTFFLDEILENYKKNNIRTNMACNNKQQTFCKKAFRFARKLYLIYKPNT